MTLGVIAIGVLGLASMAVRHSRRLCGSEQTARFFVPEKEDTSADQARNLACRRETHPSRRIIASDPSATRRHDRERLAEIFQGYSGTGSLNEAFQQRFGIELDEEQLDGSHQIVIVAAMLDASTERIVQYLSDKDIPINVVFFQVFQDGGLQLLSRSWLIDPVETEKKAIPQKRGQKGAWNGEFYVAFGHYPGRDWDEARRYGFISAGGGAWYTRTLALLSPGDRIWVLVPRVGYVGVGTVTGTHVRARDFTVETGKGRRHIFDVSPTRYHPENADDDDKTEVFVPVDWLATVPLTEAFNEVGLFGNQNTVCQPRTVKWNHTLSRLKTFFGVS